MSTLTDTDKIINEFQMNFNTQFNTSLAELKAKINQIAGQVNTLVDSFDQSYGLTEYNQISPDGNWKCKGVAGGRIYAMNGLLTMYPQTAKTWEETHAPLVITTKKFGNCTIDVDCKLNKQLRLNDPPKAWETFWIFRSYADEQEGTLKRSNHHYYFLLKPDGLGRDGKTRIWGGWEFGKKDNKPGDVENEQQIYIKDERSETATKCKLGVTNHITWDFKDFRHIIKVDGKTLVDFKDVPNDPDKMKEGYVGLYNEDANTSFDNVMIRAN